VFALLDVPISTVATAVLDVDLALFKVYIKYSCRRGLRRSRKKSLVQFSSKASCKDEIPPPLKTVVKIASYSVNNLLASASLCTV